MSSGPELALPSFSGPLDLLLALVRKNEVAIADIPIAEITRQYLDYMRQAEKLDVELGGDFAHMAATLIHIKSRSLLPTLPVDIAGPDPREELIRQLLDHKQLQQAAEFLGQQLEVSAASWSHPSIGEFEDLANGEVTGDAEAPMNLLEVLRLARRALETARTYELVVPTETVSVEQMIAWMERRLEGDRGPVDGNGLLDEQPDTAHRVSLFLGMLELGRRRTIYLEQQAAFGTITIEPRPDTAYGTTVP